MLSLRNHLPDLSPDALVPALRDPRMARADLESPRFLARYDTLKALAKAGGVTNTAHGWRGEVWSVDPLNAETFHALARCAAEDTEAAAKHLSMQLVAEHCGVELDLQFWQDDAVEFWAHEACGRIHFARCATACLRAPVTLRSGKQVVPQCSDCRMPVACGCHRFPGCHFCVVCGMFRTSHCYGDGAQGCCQHCV